MASSSQLDYAKYTKRGLIASLVLFVIGGLGESIEYNLYGSLPEWQSALFFVCLAGGIVLALVSFFGFGIVLPLMD